MTRSRSHPNWRSDLTDIVQQAVEPLASEVKQLRTDIQRLELNQVPRSEVYDKAVMDEKLKYLADEIKAMKDFVWKVIAATYSIVFLIIAFGQHISIR